MLPSSWASWASAASVFQVPHESAVTAIAEPWSADALVAKAPAVGQRVDHDDVPSHGE
jgi:hypothetical protein